MSLKRRSQTLVPNSTERHVVFSDIDGTLVHYPTCADPLAPTWEDDHGSITGPSVHRGFSVYTDQAGRKHKVMVLPPSSSGLQGIIGMRALSSLSTLRTNGYPLILVSGARTTTVLQRLPCLPLADAVVTENGGRIFVHDPFLPTAAKFVEDTDWRQRHTPVAGPPEQDAAAPEAREGLLWETYRKFLADGWRVDAANYSTAFRVSLKGGQTTEELQTALAQLPELLTYSFNLGLADVYPATSGKEQAARYLIQQLGAPTANCSLLCDDDNDLKLAAEVGHVFVVSKTSPSIAEAAAADPDKFWVAKSGGILATEEVLYALGDRLGAFIMG